MFCSLLSKTELWHKRLGHISKNGLHYLNKQDVFGKYKISKLYFCEVCILGKQQRLSFNLSVQIMCMLKSRALLKYKLKLEITISYP